MNLLFAIGNMETLQLCKGHYNVLSEVDWTWAKNDEFINKLMYMLYNGHTVHWLLAQSESKSLADEILCSFYNEKMEPRCVKHEVNMLLQNSHVRVFLPAKQTHKKVTTLWITMCDACEGIDITSVVRNAL